MAQTVRIDELTHALLKRLADADGVSLHEELARAVQARQKERFFRDMAEGYAAMSPEQRAEDVAESAVWDGSVSDGLEHE